MRSAKRKKPDDNSDINIHPFSLTHLPVEIQARIIEFACRLPPLSLNDIAATPETEVPTSQAAIRSSIPSRTLLDLDFPTTLSLALTSRTMYTHAVAVLWSHVRLNRPSQLRAFQGALSTRPYHGRFVKSLHIGPDDKDEYLELSWYPIMIGQASQTGRLHEYISTTLRSPEERQLRPKWSQDIDAFPISREAARDCRELALVAAIQAASDSIDVDFKNQAPNYARRTVQDGKTIVRMLEIQAALDLYLIAMRQIEDKDSDFEASWRSKPPSTKQEVPKSCRDGTCGHYPPLELAGSLTRARRPTSPSTTEPLVFVRSQLLEHLARRGSSTDRFDHPLLWFRSGGSFADFRRYGRSGATSGAWQAGRAQIPTEDVLLSGGIFGTCAEAIDVALPSTATMASLLDLARSVLAFTPRLANLSLTGFLERALCGPYAPPELPALRSVTLGPPPPFWAAPMHLQRLSGVEKLRICGVMLFEEEISAIVQLPDLKHFQWALADKFSERHSISLFDTIDALWGRSRPDSGQGGENPQTSHSDTKGSSEKMKVEQAEAEVGGSSDEARLPLINAVLRYDDVATLYDRHPTDKLYWASIFEDPLADETPRRLLLQTSRAAGLGAKRESPLGGISKGWEVLYNQGRDWWNREARM